MNLKQVSRYTASLLILEQIKKQGSIKEAATQLNVDPGTLRHQLENVETMLNEKLFTTTIKGAILTDAGMTLLNRNIHDLHTILGSFTTADYERNRNIRVWAPAGFISFLTLSHTLKDLKECFPDRNLLLDSYKRHELEENGYHMKYRITTYDIVMLHSDFMQYLQADNWLVLLSFVDEFKLMASRSYLQQLGTGSTTTDMQTLASQATLIRDSNSHSDSLEVFDETNGDSFGYIHFQGNIQTNDLVQKMLLIKQGYGTGTLPVSFQDSMHASDLVPVFPHYTSKHNMLLLCNRDMLISSRQMHFIRELLKAGWEKHTNQQADQA